MRLDILGCTGGGLDVLGKIQGLGLLDEFADGRLSVILALADPTAKVIQEACLSALERPSTTENTALVYATRRISGLRP